MNIYFKGAEEAKSVKELLKIGFHSKYYYTYFVPTFLDKELTKKQCDGARRSFGDLYYICKTYFPKVTKKQLAFILLNEIYGITCFYCPNIKKLVFLREGSDETCTFDARCGDEYTESFKYGKGLSFEDIQKLSKDYKSKTKKS